MSIDHNMDVPYQMYAVNISLSDYYYKGIIKLLGNFVLTRPRAIPPAKITMRKATHGVTIFSYQWISARAPLVFYLFFNFNFFA